jgi:hypothetical protein
MDVLKIRISPLKTKGPAKTGPFSFPPFIDKSRAIRRIVRTDANKDKAKQVLDGLFGG